MQPWARRGLRTAMVTGGLLMLGTGIASANENVNPDLPPSPLDTMPTQPLSHAAAPPGTEEVGSLENTYTTMSDNALGDRNAANVVTTQLADVQHAPATGAPHDEWATLSGDLFDPPSTALSSNGTVFRVPGDILGRAVGNDPAPAPDIPSTQAAEQFGPSDAADLLLGANQVPLLSNLFTAPRPPGRPVLSGPGTRIRPAVADRPTQQNTPFSPVSGELPVSGSLPTLPKPPTVTAPASHIEPLRDLPPVPTLPAMPALPDLRRAPGTQDRPAIPAVPTVPAVPAPTTQDVPAGAAQQLMAQLRGLISELENSGGGHLHPLNVTALQAPDLQPPTL